MDIKRVRACRWHIIAHGEAIRDLLIAMQLPKKLAIIKCASHKTDSIMRGNNADEMAK